MAMRVPFTTAVEEATGRRSLRSCRRSTSTRTSPPRYSCWNRPPVRWMGSSATSRPLHSSNALNCLATEGSGAKI